MSFDSFVMVDWSGGKGSSPKPKADAIWACYGRGGVVQEPVYLRNRQVAEDWLADLIEAEVTAKRRVMLGFDFPFGYPLGFAKALTGKDDPFAVWSWFADHIEDTPKANNRFDVAGQINLQFAGTGPFWGNGLKRDIVGLPRTKAGYQNPFPERRKAEDAAKGAFTCWQMSGVGSVGSQVMMGLPVLHRLRARFEGQVAVWPFEALDKPVAFIEIWPSLTASKAPEGWIKDAWQVHQVVSQVMALPAARLDAMLDVPQTVEGSIFGLGYVAELIGETSPTPPPLRDDCFALPAGVEWTPVDAALETLRRQLSPVAGTETRAADQTHGRIVAQDVMAQRANPPLPNTAVDGYGFAGPAAEGAHVMPLIDGRAAAGLAYAGRVPKGAAIRILTGAALPSGVDTVVLQEDVNAQSSQVAFNGPIKRGANTRKAGEDVLAGDTIIAKGRRITPADMALMAATGVQDIEVRKPLRVGVLSTGDEVVRAGTSAADGQIYDANRPMLLSLLDQFGFEAVDLGISADDPKALRKKLDQAAPKVDAILTSGGASSGDEDHVSALLRDAGAMTLWRIAVKPGRPLALGLWQGVPVFGLPGNPVAAMVCTLIFARPALGVLAGAEWSDPQGFDVPVAFAKSKKAGRREYLRARVRGGKAEVFGSEGSGRISGLSWAEGLVELSDEAQEIRQGDMVRFIPYASFSA